MTCRHSLDLDVLHANPKHRDCQQLRSGPSTELAGLLCLGLHYRISVAAYPLQSVQVLLTLGNITKVLHAAGRFGKRISTDGCCSRSFLEKLLCFWLCQTPGNFSEN